MHPSSSRILAAIRFVVYDPYIEFQLQTIHYLSSNEFLKRTILNKRQTNVKEK